MPTAMNSAPASPQVFLITGCASGIGRHLAQRVASAGHQLLATDVNADALVAESARLNWQPPRVQTGALDVRDPVAWQATIDRAIAAWGRIDVLFNVAGVILPGNVHEITPERMLTHLDVNARGVMLGTQAAARQMVRQGHGHIVNIASLAGVAPIPGIASYSASKFAARGFSLAVAHELAPHGVSVSCVCPDAVETLMLELQMSHEAAALTFSAPRFLSVEDVAGVIFDRVLTRRPLEVLIPRHRGWLAKLTSLLPWTEGWLLPKMLRDSRKRQAEYRQSRED
jgi:3-oxoacyl-[acyl-carrier protein] reductase